VIHPAMPCGALYVRPLGTASTEGMSIHSTRFARLKGVIHTIRPSQGILSRPQRPLTLPVTAAPTIYSPSLRRLGRSSQVTPFAPPYNLSRTVCRFYPPQASPPRELKQNLKANPVFVHLSRQLRTILWIQSASRSRFPPRCKALPKAQKGPISEPSDASRGPPRRPSLIHPLAFAPPQPTASV